jgi:hypothetical protein
VNELQRVLSEISPRAATVTLLMFEQVVERYQRQKGYVLGDDAKHTIRSVLQYIVTRESRDRGALD